MKIYIKDCGFRGSIVVIANSKVEAIEVMKTCDNYIEESPSGAGGIEEKEIVNGLVHCDLGDS